jgi:parvulin-like peptidyl-prolyl isomerase
MRVPACALPGLSALALVSCVLTTVEGPSEPPRHPGPPVLPGSPSSGSTTPPAAAADGDEPAAEPGPEQVSARHLLVSYRGAQNASPTIVRSKDEARARAGLALTRARAGEDFATLVAEYSDEPGAAERGGDLGSFRREQMVPRFSEAAFALAPNAVSEVVETEFGFHVIQRTR